MDRRKLVCWPDGHGQQLAAYGRTALRLMGARRHRAQKAALARVHSLPSFVAQGEFSNQATAADVIEVECNPFLYGTGSKVTVIASQLYSRCNGEITWYIPNPYNVTDGRSVELTLDADGNATVALIAGPKCQAGESLVSVHQDEGEYNSYTTSFTVLPPNDTPLGVMAAPSHQVEDAESSAIATIIQAEFPGAAESYVHVGSEELYRRCAIDPNVHWILGSRREFSDTSEISGQPAARQQRQRFRDCHRRLFVRAGHITDRSRPGRKTVHDGNDQLHGRIAETDGILGSCMAV